MKKDVATKSHRIGGVWDFEATKLFIKTDEHLAGNRDWLLALIEAVEQKDRASMLTALDAVQAKLPTTNRR